MMYESKCYYFDPYYDFVEIAKSGDVIKLLNAVKDVTMNFEKPDGFSVNATNQTEYLLDELARQNEFELLDHIAACFEKLFVAVEDYNSLLVLMKYKQHDMSDVAKAILAKYEYYRNETRRIFEVEKKCKPFEVDKPFKMKYKDGKLTFIADNGIEYRIYRLDYSEFGKLN